MSIDEIFSKHKRATLFYSGGKDSLCCLLLMEPYWDRLDVVWVDTGGHFPEVYEHINRVRSLVPHFVTLRSDVYRFQEEYGYPVDVVSSKHTRLGNYVYGKTPIVVCGAFDCCSANVWRPMEDYVRATRPTCIVRGDRSCERTKGETSWSGAEVVFPIFDWTHEQIMEVLMSDAKGLVQYRHGFKDSSSLDCKTCTAFTGIGSERSAYIKEKYPQLAATLEAFLASYKAELLQEINNSMEL